MEGDFITPLCIGVCTQISEEYIDSLMREAHTWPDGSRESIALMNYAKRLKERLDKQIEMDA